MGCTNADNTGYLKANNGAPSYKTTDMIYMSGVQGDMGDGSAVAAAWTAGKAASLYEKVTGTITLTATMKDDAKTAKEFSDKAEFKTIVYDALNDALSGTGDDKDKRAALPPKADFKITVSGWRRLDEGVRQLAEKERTMKVAWEVEMLKTKAAVVRTLSKKASVLTQLLTKYKALTAACGGGDWWCTKGEKDMTITVAAAATAAAASGTTGTGIVAVMFTLVSLSF